MRIKTLRMQSVYYFVHPRRGLEKAQELNCIIHLHYLNEMLTTQDKLDWKSAQ
jgi:hypothetical protein